MVTRDASIHAQPEFIRLLGTEIRWQIVQALKRGDQRVQELVEQLQQPKNLLSYHLKLLREQSVVHYRRSDADKRDYYYSLNVARLQALYQQAGADLHLTAPPTPLPPPMLPDSLWQPPLRVLFLCTRNAARSQMAEGIFRHLAGENAEVFSAGSQPAGVHPYAVQVMAEWGIDIHQQESRPVATFAGQQFDYVITVCDNMREVCPTFPGQTETLHWSFADPLAAPEDTRLDAFRQTAQGLYNRMGYFLTLIQAEREN